MKHPEYRQLINVLENSKTVRSIGLTEKRIDVLVDALTIADSGIVDALEGLLNYTGGWDLKDPEHPIVKARVALVKSREAELELLTEHPPCQHIAKPFDIKQLTISEAFALGRMRNGPRLLDADKVPAALRGLHKHGLVSIDDAGLNTVRVAITVKGAAVGQ